MKELEAAAREVGLCFATNTVWLGSAGRKGARGYRFFRKADVQTHPDWHQGGELHTAIGRKAAQNYVKAYSQGVHAALNAVRQHLEEMPNF